MDELGEILDNFNEYIAKVPKGCLYIANALRNGDYPSALESIHDFSEGMLWLTDVTNIVAENGINYDFDLPKMESFLNDINLGLELKDYELVATIFERKIAPFFDALSEIPNLIN